MLHEPWPQHCRGLWAPRTSPVWTCPRQRSLPGHAVPHSRRASKGTEAAQQAVLDACISIVAGIRDIRMSSHDVLTPTCLSSPRQDGKPQRKRRMEQAWSICLGVSPLFLLHQWAAGCVRPGSSGTVGVLNDGFCQVGDGTALRSRGSWCGEPEALLLQKEKTVCPGKAQATPWHRAWCLTATGA